MAAIIYNDGDRVVQTIADRNAIATKFDGMEVLVRDAIADVLVGGSFEAGYTWSASKGAWLLIWKQSKDNLVFATETHVIADGKAIADHVPQNGIVWEAVVIDPITGIIMAEISSPVLTDSTVDIQSLDFEGKNLRFSYAYGAIQAAVQNAAMTIPVEVKTAAWTLVLTNRGHRISTNSNVTIPANVFSAGDAVLVYNNSGANINILTSGGVSGYLDAVDAAKTSFTVPPKSLAGINFNSANSVLVTGKMVS